MRTPLAARQRGHDSARLWRRDSAIGAGGWVGISAPQDQGGQGLPELFGTAACEMWNSADMAFALEPFLSAGAALAISAHANEALKAPTSKKSIRVSGRAP
jgi:alkylation response protein AidB-like acyl-CoA dehydrogenase